MEKRKPVIEQFIEVAYNITLNTEDYETLADVRTAYKNFCRDNNIFPMDDNIFLTVLLNKYPGLTLTTMILNEQETPVITRLAPI